MASPNHDRNKDRTLQELVQLMLDGMGSPLFRDRFMAATPEGEEKLAEIREDAARDFGEDEVRDTDALLIPIEAIPEGAPQQAHEEQVLPITVVIAAGAQAIALEALIPAITGGGPIMGMLAAMGMSQMDQAPPMTDEEIEDIDRRVAEFDAKHSPLPDPDQVDIDDELGRFFGGQPSA